MAISLHLLSCKKESSQSIINNAPGDEVMHTFSVEGNKLIIKEKEGIYYLSEDMILSEDQFKLISSLGKKSLSPTQQSLYIKNLAKRWTNNTVYYSLDTMGADTAAIVYGLKLISQYTSLSFVKRTTQANYIRFRKWTGNSSSVGMIGGRQWLNLVNYDMPGKVIHEMFHALGVMHEQCRPDRDGFVLIHNENIPDEQEYNFNKVSSSSYSTAGSYNFESIMMYDPYSFSSNGQPTITKLDGSVYIAATPGICLTPKDIVGINTMYPGITYANLANGNYEIASALNTSKMLEVSNAGTADGTRVALHTDNNEAHARWTFTKNSDGYYRITPTHATTKALTVVGGGTSSGTEMEIRTYSGANTQLFNVVKNLDNKWLISPLNAPNKCLRMMSTSSGTIAILSTADGETDDKFEIRSY